MTRMKPDSRRNCRVGSAEIAFSPHPVSLPRPIRGQTPFLESAVMIRLQKVSKTLRRPKRGEVTALARFRLRGREGRVRLHRRPQRQRQIHPPPDDGRHAAPHHRRSVELNGRDLYSLSPGGSRHDSAPPRSASCSRCSTSSPTSPCWTTFSSPPANLDATAASQQRGEADRRNGLVAPRSATCPPNSAPANASAPPLRERIDHLAQGHPRRRTRPANLDPENAADAVRNI